MFEEYGFSRDYSDTLDAVKITFQRAASCSEIEAVRVMG